MSPDRPEDAHLHQHSPIAVEHNNAAAGRFVDAECDRRRATQGAHHVQLVAPVTKRLQLTADLACGRDQRGFSIATLTNDLGGLASRHAIRDSCKFAGYRSWDPGGWISSDIKPALGN